MFSASIEVSGVVDKPQFLVLFESIISPKYRNYVAFGNAMPLHQGMIFQRDLVIAGLSCKSV